jgi:hypothetical protein
MRRNVYKNRTAQHGRNARTAIRGASVPARWRVISPGHRAGVCCGRAAARHAAVHHARGTRARGDVRADPRWCRTVLFRRSANFATFPRRTPGRRSWRGCSTLVRAGVGAVLAVLGVTGPRDGGPRGRIEQSQTSPTKTVTQSAVVHVRRRPARRTEARAAGGA